MTSMVRYGIASKQIFHGIGIGMNELLLDGLIPDTNELIWGPFYWYGLT